MHQIRLWSAAALALACAAAGAQSMKPGLWEITTKMKSNDAALDRKMAEAQKQIANMPPEQRKMMQDMMAKNGVSMGAAGPAGMSMKVCMTEEMVKRSEVPQQQQQGDCKSQASPRVGNSVEITYTCTNPPSSGKGRFTFVSQEAYTSQMSSVGTRNGKPQQTDIDSQGKWLSADCGAIKPMTPPTK